MWKVKTNSSSQFEDRVFDEAENVIERIDKLMYSLRDAKREMIQDMESETARGAQEAIWNMQMNLTSVQAHMKRLENAVEAASETASLNSARRRNKKRLNSAAIRTQGYDDVIDYLNSLVDVVTGLISQFQDAYEDNPLNAYDLVVEELGSYGAVGELSAQTVKAAEAAADAEIKSW